MNLNFCARWQTHLLHLLLAGVIGGLLPAIALAEDLGQGSQAEIPSIFDPSHLFTDCYAFGGTSESYSGSGRGRGNTYTVTDAQMLGEFTQWLDISGTATVYFYVLQSATLSGTYTVTHETILQINGTGQAFYSSGPIAVSLVPGMYYGIGTAWGPETIGYFRDAASLPRTWDLGTVEDAMQISEPPPYTSLTYNHFPGAEYAMELCFDTGTPSDGTTWGRLKEFFR